MSLIEPVADAYRREFSPRDYLDEYYRVAPEDAGDPEILSRDAQAIVRLLEDVLRGRGGPYKSAIDVGCGPTLHNAFAVAPWVGEICLADYVPSNLDEARRWVEAAPDAFDWDPHFRHILALEGGDLSRLDERKALLRQRVAEFKVCDLRGADPLGDGSKYDLVTSIYCTEAVTSHRADWERMTRNLANLRKPGGTLVIAALERCRSYDVGERAFATTYLEARDFAGLFAGLGFAPERVRIETVACPEWREYGMESVLLAVGGGGAAELEMVRIP